MNPHGNGLAISVNRNRRMMVDMICFGSFGKIFVSCPIDPIEFGKHNIPSVLGATIGVCDFHKMSPYSQRKIGDVINIRKLV